jgi:hypothetical protein
VLSEEFMKPLGLSSYRVAQDIDVPAPRINDIVLRRRGITADRRGLFLLLRPGTTSRGIDCTAAAEQMTPLIQ